jgi:hypothetical protein
MKTLIAVTILSCASLMVYAASSSTESAAEVQSFVGTTPNASNVGEQPTTF